MDNNRELENLERNIASGLNSVAANTAPVEPTEPEQQEEQLVPEQDYPYEEEKPAEPVEEKNSPQKSWRELREKAEQADKLKKERDEYLALLKQIEREAIDYQSRQKPLVKEQEPDEFDYNKLDDDEILTARDLKRSFSKEQARLKRIEEELKMQQVRHRESLVEAELKAKHADLYDVLTESNITKLREVRPSLAKSINLNPDLKEKALDTYQAIKDLGIYQESNRQDVEKISKNIQKPRTSNSLAPQGGNSPLSKANQFANGLTEEMKRTLYQEMLEKAGKF
jgi:hypothetical protein